MSEETTVRECSCALEVCGYRPGVIGEITRAHAEYYFRHWGFDHTFEAQVARETSAFVLEFAPEKDGLWVARLGGEFAGSVAVQATGLDEPGARIRWFLVPAQHHGRGIGRDLLARAVDFCRTRHPRLHLWTFAGLDQARRLYEAAGFALTEEHPVDQWGGAIREQRFDLVFPE